MRNDNEFSLLDIEDEINYAIANELDTHFIVTGDVADHIVRYLETEHEMPQFSEDEDGSDKLYDFVDYEVYTISIMTDDDYTYFAQETYYDKPYGRILAECGDEEDIVYIESETDLSLQDLKRVHSKQTIIFDLEESRKCGECNGCLFVHECEGNESDEEYATLDKVAENAMMVPYLLDRIETLECIVAELEHTKQCATSFEFNFDDYRTSLDKIPNLVDKLLSQKKMR